MSGTRSSNVFVSRLQAALTLEEVEASFLEATPAVVEARARALYRLDVDGAGTIAVASDAEVEFLGEYEDYGRADDPVLEVARARGRAVDTRTPDVAVRWAGSGAHDVLSRAGFVHAMQAAVVASGITCATVNFARTAGDAPFDAADRRMASYVGEQLGYAIERAVRYEHLGVRLSAYEAALDRLPQAVVLSEDDGRPVFANRAARSGGEGGMPSLLDRAQRLITEAAEQFRSTTDRVKTAMSEADGSGAARIVVKSARVGRKPSGLAMNLIYLVSGQQSARLPACDVLSPREQQIAELVSEGLTTRQIAQHAYVSENTVKQHLKRVFAKLAVHNRAELLQTIWASQPAEQPDGDPAGVADG